MKKINGLTHKEWLEEFGEHLRSLIKDKGYNSPHDFWINSEIRIYDLEKRTIYQVIKGEKDLKCSTIRKFAAALKVRESVLLDF